MKTQKQLQEYIALHPGLPDWKISRNFHRHGVRSEEVRAARAAMATATNKLTGHGGPPNKGMGKPVSQLLDQFDEVKKLKQAMKQLGKDQYADDDEMRRTLSVTPDRWRALVQHPEVAGFRYALPKGRHVWMHPESQQRLQSAINLDTQS